MHRTLVVWLWQVFSKYKVHRGGFAHRQMKTWTFQQNASFRCRTTEVYYGCETIDFLVAFYLRD